MTSLYQIEDISVSNRTTLTTLNHQSSNIGNVLVDNGVNVIPIPVGNDTYVLSANSSVTNGVEWIENTGGETGELSFGITFMLNFREAQDRYGHLQSASSASSSNSYDLFGYDVSLNIERLTMRPAGNETWGSITSGSFDFYLGYVSQNDAGIPGNFTVFSAGAADISVGTTDANTSVPKVSGVLNYTLSTDRNLMIWADGTGASGPGAVSGMTTAYLTVTGQLN